MEDNISLKRKRSEDEKKSRERKYQREYKRMKRKEERDRKLIDMIHNLVLRINKREVSEKNEKMLFSVLHDPVVSTWFFQWLSDKDIKTIKELLKHLPNKEYCMLIKESYSELIQSDKEFEKISPIITKSFNDDNKVYRLFCNRVVSIGITKEKPSLLYGEWREIRNKLKLVFPYQMSKLSDTRIIDIWNEIVKPRFDAMENLNNCVNFCNFGKTRRYILKLAGLSKRSVNLNDKRLLTKLKNKGIINIHIHEDNKKEYIITSFGKSVAEKLATIRKR